MICISCHTNHFISIRKLLHFCWNVIYVTSITILYCPSENLYVLYYTTIIIVATEINFGNLNLDIYINTIAITLSAILVLLFVVILVFMFIIIIVLEFACHTSCTKQLLSAVSKLLTCIRNIGRQNNRFCVNKYASVFTCITFSYL